MTEDVVQADAFNFPAWFRDSNSTTLNLFVGTDPKQCRHRVLKSRFVQPHHLHERNKAKLKELNRFAYDISSLRLDRAQALVQALPQVIKLRVILHQVDVTPIADALIHLFRHWGAILVEFKLYSHFNQISAPEEIIKAQLCLFKAINDHLSVLRYLTLEFENQLLPSQADNLHELNQRIELPILDHLERVYLYSPDPASVFQYVLQRYASPHLGNIENRDLRIANLIQDPISWNLFDKTDPIVLRHLTQANIYYGDLPVVPLDLITLCGGMPNLTTLVLSIRQPPGAFPLALRTLTEALFSFEGQSQLHFLQLIFVDHDPPRLIFNAFPPDYSFFELPSVRELQLNFILFEHADIEEPGDFEDVFVALELIIVKYRIVMCEDCGFFDGRFVPQRSRMPHNQEGDFRIVQDFLDEDEEVDAYQQDEYKIYGSCHECARALFLQAQHAYAHWLKKGVRTVFLFKWMVLDRDPPILKFDSRYPERGNFLLSTDPIDYN